MVPATVYISRVLAVVPPTQLCSSLLPKTPCNPTPEYHHLSRSSQQHNTTTIIIIPFFTKMLIPNTSFEVLEDTRPDDVSLPAFMVSATRGFLPRMNPIVALPKEFDAVEDLLRNMPVLTQSGNPGFLATGQLGDEVQKLPDLTDDVEKYKDNLPMMNALYRDYSFLASAYLLEPCHMRFMKGEPYGLARSFLPAQLSRPIARCAELYVILFDLYKPRINLN